MINKRISDLSCNEEEYGKVKSIYESALKDSEHFSSMSYNKSITQNSQRNRNRKVIWFNPPYSQNVKTNIGKLFIKLVRKHFPENNKGTSKHPITALFTMELLNGSSKHGITTMQNLLDIVNAGMRLIYQNMCRN